MFVWNGGVPSAGVIRGHDEFVREQVVWCAFRAVRYSSFYVVGYLHSNRCFNTLASTHIPGSFFRLTTPLVSLDQSVRASTAGAAVSPRNAWHSRPGGKRHRVAL